MARTKGDEPARPGRKLLAWLHGEVKTPPFTAEGRREAGYLLGLLQAGEALGMPQAEPLPVVGPRCGVLRVRDAGHHWRIMYRVDSNAVLVLDVYAKKTRRIPEEVIGRCRKRLKEYDDAAGRPSGEAAAGKPKGRRRKSEG